MDLESKITHLKKLNMLGIPKDKFTLIQSAWFPLMGIRINGDLDFIIESSLIPLYKEKILKIKGLNIKINNNNYHKFGCISDDDLIKNHSVIIDGYKFCYFKFYYKILKQRRSPFQKKDSKGIPDIDNVNDFFKNNKHLQYPFKNVPIYTWGIL